MFAWRERLGTVELWGRSPLRLLGRLSQFQIGILEAEKGTIRILSLFEPHQILSSDSKIVTSLIWYLPHAIHFDRKGYAYSTCDLVFSPYTYNRN